MQINNETYYTNRSGGGAHSYFSYADKIFYLDQIITAPYRFGIAAPKTTGKEKIRRTLFYRIKTSEGEIHNIKLSSLASFKPNMKSRAAYN